jgi:Antibiotic biosynthesis monooxygenase
VREEPAIYAAIRHYEMGAGAVGELMRIVDEEFADTLSRQPGFVGYEVVASGSDEIVALTVFEDEQSALESNDLAARFVGERLGRFELNLVSAMSGEVGVSRFDSRALDRMGSKGRS